MLMINTFSSRILTALCLPLLFIARDEAVPVVEGDMRGGRGKGWRERGCRDEAESADDRNCTYSRNKNQLQERDQYLRRRQQLNGVANAHEGRDNININAVLEEGVDHDDDHDDDDGGHGESCDDMVMRPTSQRYTLHYHASDYRVASSVYLFSAIWKVFHLLLFVFVERRHLMVWRVFAPKLLFECVSVLIAAAMEIVMSVVITA